MTTGMRKKYFPRGGEDDEDDGGGPKKFNKSITTTELYKLFKMRLGRYNAIGGCFGAEDCYACGAVDALRCSDAIEHAFFCAAPAAIELRNRLLPAVEAAAGRRKAIRHALLGRCCPLARPRRPRWGRPPACCVLRRPAALLRAAQGRGTCSPPRGRLRGCPTSCPRRGWYGTPRGGGFIAALRLPGAPGSSGSSA